MFKTYFCYTFTFCKVADPNDEIASCANRCDEPYFPGKPCYCNSACQQYENCCYDYFKECLREYTIWFAKYVNIFSIYHWCEFLSIAQKYLKLLANSIAGYVYPDDWVVFDGHQYRFYPDTTITALESRAACLEHGALLASINSAEEQEFISTSVFSRRTLAAFIGGTDEATGISHRHEIFGNPSDTIKFCCCLQV